MDEKVLDRLLEQVEKPGRYIGGEWNSVRKDLSGVDVKFALCFPELYEIGMSHTGFKLIYHLLNERDDVACERVFAPAVDMEATLRKERLPLFSLESKKPLRDFDILGFSLAYEMTFTNVLNVLELSGIPIFSEERGDGDPLVVGGGVAAFNPEPMSAFIDLFVIGEAEEALPELLEAYKRFRKTVQRNELIKILSRIKGVYAPLLYKADYFPDGKIRSFSQSHESAPPVIEKRIVKDLDKSYYPTKQIVPFIRIVHDRISLEIMRGCPNTCRFCQAKSVYHHKRERSLDRILELAGESARFTGYEEISLLSLSSGDYSKSDKLISSMVDKFTNAGISVSLPSLRIDNSLKNLPDMLKKIGIKTLTFAPEAGSETLRKIINKNININHLYETTDALNKAGWRNIKLYFMIGLPGEKKEDLYGILDIIHRIKGNLSVSISPFLPKPHTPFQWEPMETPEILREKSMFLKRGVKSKRIKLDFREPELSFMEGALSRGDRRLAAVIYGAFKRGARFDGWGEHFNLARWLEAFNESGLDPAFYLYRERGYDEALPWDHIKTGLSKDYLIRESEEARTFKLGRI